MAAAGSTLPSDDQSTPTESEDPILSTENHWSATNNNNSLPPRPGQHLDDADLLAWKRQYANIGLREKNVMSNSADDLSQLIDHAPYQFEVFGQNFNDMDDDEIHFDNGNNYDYETVIQDRLKKANEEFKHDDTPAELKHRQRVSFDAVVKAVDIVQDPQEHVDTGAVVKPPVSPVSEESSNSANTPPNETDGNQYTVPLNDTQPKEGPTLLQQLKAMQFHGVPPAGDRWSTPTVNRTRDSSNQEGNVSPTNSNTNNSPDIDDNSDKTMSSSSLPKKSMLVSINGGFELQNEDDYMAKDGINGRQHDSDSDSDDEDNNKKRSSTEITKPKFVPTPPTDANPRQDPSKSQTSVRPYAFLNRPKPSDKDNQNTSPTNNRQRPKSAGVSKSLEPLKIRPSSGIDFKELNRKAAEKKRLELEEERRKQKEAEDKRNEQINKAKKSFEEWIHRKDTARKRLNDEKRLEYEEQEARREKCEKELEELREKKFQEWVERKNRDVMIANEFRKLQAEEEKELHGSSASINSPNRRGDHRAFHRWLRRKYEQSKEEKRILRLEARRLRRRQRRSIKRFQLQQDIQLAKSFGYS